MHNVASVLHAVVVNRREVCAGQPLLSLPASIDRFCNNELNFTFCSMAVVSYDPASDDMEERPFIVQSAREEPKVLRNIST
jgi:hypothetical protein